MFFIGVGATIAAECIALIVAAIVKYCRQQKALKIINREFHLKNKWGGE